MSILSKFFGTPKLVDTAADAVKTGVGMLDNAFYTDQEKAADAHKMVETWIKIQETTASENSIRSITRRVLAWIIMGAFISLVIFACGAWKIDPAWADYIKQMLVDTSLGYLALIVGFFYFGSYAVGQYVKK